VRVGIGGGNPIQQATPPSEKRMCRDDRPRPVDSAAAFATALAAALGALAMVVGGALPAAAPVAVATAAGTTAAPR